jgi:hypothetical protein
VSERLRGVDRLHEVSVAKALKHRNTSLISAFPLPRDAALRGFHITGDGFEAHSELKQTEEAVAAYEQGVADGSLSALALQYGDGLVNLAVGNVRPGETVTVYLELLAEWNCAMTVFGSDFPSRWRRHITPECAWPPPAPKARWNCPPTSLVI